MRLLAFIILALPAWAGIGSVTLTLRDGSNTVRTNDWVTTGVPLPRGTGVTDAANLMVTNGAGTTRDSMRTVLSRWGGAPTDTTKEIKWILLDFRGTTTSGGDATYFLKDRVGADPGTAPTVSVTTDSTYITVNTGTGGVTAKIRRDKFTILDSLVMNATSTTLVTAGGGAFNVVAGGVTYSSTNAGSYTADIEAPGATTATGASMRAQIHVTGTFRDGSNNAACRFDARLLFYAGSTIVKLVGTYITDQDMYTFKPSDISISLPLTIGDSMTFNSGATSFSTAPGDDSYLVQDDYNHFSISKNAVSQATGTTSSGWVDLSDGSNGMTAYIRDMWQLYPNEIEANGKTLITHLWPAHADLVSVVAGKQAAALTALTGSAVTQLYWPYQQTNLMDMRPSVAVTSASACSPSTQCIANTDNFQSQNFAGRAKTWEIMLSFHGATSDAAGTSARFQNFLLAMNADWFCAAKVLEVPCTSYDNTSTAYGPLLGSDIETFLDTWFTTTTTLQSNLHLYGSMVYGDHVYGTRIDPTSRNWYGANIDWYNEPMVLYARAGEKKSDSRKYFDFSYAAALHTGDVDRDHVLLTFLDACGTTSLLTGVSGDCYCKTHTTFSTPWCDSGGAGETLMKAPGGVNDTQDFGIGHARYKSDLATLTHNANGNLIAHARTHGILMVYFLTGMGRALDLVNERISFQHTYVDTSLNTSMYEPAAGRGVGANLDITLCEMDLTGDATMADKLWDMHLIPHTQSPSGLFLENGNSVVYGTFAADYNDGALYQYAVLSNYTTRVLNPVRAALYAPLATGPLAISPPSSNSHGNEQIQSSMAAGQVYDLTGDALARNYAWRWARINLQSSLANVSCNGGAAAQMMCGYGAISVASALKGWNSYVEPRYPTGLVRLGSGVAQTFQARKTTDVSWNVILVAECQGTEATWAGAGNCATMTVDIRNPSNVSVSGYPVTWTLPTDVTDVEPVGGADQRYRTFSVPTDGTTGDYNIVISQTGNTGSQAIGLAGCSVSKCWFHGIDTNQLLWSGIYWFYVPDTTPFTIASVGTGGGLNYTLVKGDGTVLQNVSATSHSITPTSGQVGLWQVVFDRGSPTNASLQITGSSMTGNLSVSAATNPDLTVVIPIGSYSGRASSSGKLK